MSHEVLARKIAAIRGRTARVRELLPATVDAFLSRRTEAEALMLNLFLALQECSDLALHLVAGLGLGVPGEARAAFDLLARNDLIPAPLARKLSAAVGLRDRIAHEYGGLDLRKVYAAARDDLGDLDAYVNAVASTRLPALAASCCPPSGGCVRTAGRQPLLRTGPAAPGARCPSRPTSAGRHHRARRPARSGPDRKSVV